MKTYLLLLLTCFFSTFSFAKSITNQELLTACKDKSPAPQNFCYGFIIATSNAAQFYRNIADTQGEYIRICFPNGISNQEIVSEYITWIEKNPSLMEGPAFIGVSASFSTTYSCPSKKENKAKQ